MSPTTEVITDTLLLLLCVGGVIVCLMIWARRHARPTKARYVPQPDYQVESDIGIRPHTQRAADWPKQRPGFSPSNTHLLRKTESKQ